MSISENAMNGLNRRNFLVGAGAAATVSTFSITGRAKAASAGKVVFYSTMPTRYADDMVKAFQASDVGKESGVELEFYFANGYVLYERAVAEYTAGRVSHDLIMLTDPSLLVALKQDNRLMDYQSPELQAYSADQRDPDGLWCNGRTILTIYGYNTRLVPDGASKTKWAEFLDPRFDDGLIGITNPLESGGAMQNYINLRNHPDLGRKFWEELAAMKPTIVGGPSPLTKMNISGQTALALNNDYNVYEQNKEGAPVAAVYPTEVITASITPMAIVREARNPEGAKVVFDWWLSQEGQTVLRDVNSIYSGRTDVPPLPGTPELKDLNIAITTIDELEGTRDEMQKEFKELFNV